MFQARGLRLSNKPDRFKTPIDDWCQDDIYRRNRSDRLEMEGQKSIPIDYKLTGNLYEVDGPLRKILTWPTCQWNSSLRQRQDQGASQVPSHDNGQQSGFRNSLGSDELKAILQAARENAQVPASDVSDTEFEPGDIQHLRGTSKPGIDVSNADLPPLSWHQLPHGPDKLLETAERHIAQAIMDSSSPMPAGTTNSTSPRRQADSGMKQMPAQGLTLEDLGDLDLDITIELGRSEILIEDVLKLREGSVVSLDKRAGDPVDIFANGRLIARGELLVIDGKFGVRLSEVL